MHSYIRLRQLYQSFWEVHSWHTQHCYTHIEDQKRTNLLGPTCWVLWCCTWLLYRYVVFMNTDPVPQSLYLPVRPPLPQRGVEQFDGDKGVPQSVCPALWKEQPVAELAPLAAGESVQRVVGVVQNAPSLTPSPEGPAACQPMSRSAFVVLLQRHTTASTDC